MENLTGLILIDKAAGLSSYDIVRKVKKSLNIKKVGHFGTLDPFATGLLPIAVGSSTRLSEYLLEKDKKYIFTIELGKETDTLDAYGKIVKEAPVPSDFPKKIQDVILSFVGLIEQEPPSYSALKFAGRPLYEYMRTQGKLPINMSEKKRHINIYELELIHFDSTKKQITLKLFCSKGTYVRSLARDIAKLLGTVGFCKELRRTEVGEFSIENALQTKEESCFVKEFLIDNILSPEKTLSHVPLIFLHNLKFKKAFEAGNVFLCQMTDLKCEEPGFSYMNQMPSDIFLKLDNKTMFLCSCKIESHDLVRIYPKKRII